MTTFKTFNELKNHLNKLVIESIENYKKFQPKKYIKNEISPILSTSCNYIILKNNNEIINIISPNELIFQGLPNLKNLNLNYLETSIHGLFLDKLSIITELDLNELDTCERINITICSNLKKININKIKNLKKLNIYNFNFRIYIN